MVADDRSVPSPSWMGEFSVLQCSASCARLDPHQICYRSAASSPWALTGKNELGSSSSASLERLRSLPTAIPRLKISSLRHRRLVRRLHELFHLQPSNARSLANGAVYRASLNVVLSVVPCVAVVATGHALVAQFKDGATRIAQIDIEQMCNLDRRSHARPARAPFSRR